MRWTRGLKVSAEMLMAHKLRTLLSLLGIVVGIATVSVMAAVGKGSEQKVMDGIRSMGTNLISISAGKVTLIAGRERQGAVVTTLLPEDADAIESGAGDWISLVAPAQARKMPVKFEEVALKTNIVGTKPEFLAIRNLRLETGEMFDDQDNRATRRVAVVGQTMVRDLFGGTNPLGQTIRVGKVPFEVIGVLAPAGVDMNGADQDDQILIPLRTALRRVFNVIYLNNIYVQVRSEKQMDQCAARLSEILRERHRLRAGKADDFTIQNQAELLKAQQETQRTFTSLTVGVASLSLVVGGVGILAVMLMSVRERVKEIGLRRALGARRGDILFQFLVEAVMLSLSGGVVGVCVGIITTIIVAHFAGWKAILVPQIFLLAVAASAGIGLLFGTIPARKASLASPINSLRAE
jgi:putative ABC transport system permease protein